MPMATKRGRMMGSFEGILPIMSYVMKIAHFQIFEAYIISDVKV